jgi:hypothetical protein
MSFCYNVKSGCTIPGRWNKVIIECKVRIPIAMQGDLQQRRCAICGSDFLLLYFYGTARFLTPFFHSGEYSHVDTRFESLLVYAINIVTLRAAKLRSYRKQVFFFITSAILSLRSVPQENHYWNADLKMVVILLSRVGGQAGEQQRW